MLATRQTAAESWDWRTDGRTEEGRERGMGLYLQSNFNGENGSENNVKIKQNLQNKNKQDGEGGQDTSRKGERSVDVHQKRKSTSKQGASPAHHQSLSTWRQARRQIGKTSQHESPLRAGAGGSALVWRLQAGRGSFQGRPQQDPGLNSTCLDASVIHPIYLQTQNRPWDVGQESREWVCFCRAT